MGFQMERAVERMLKQRLDMKSFIVWQEGKKLGEIYWEGKGRLNVQSTAKSVTSLAIGMAIEEGVLSLKDRPFDFFKDALEADYDPRVEELTVEDILKMSNGHDQRKNIMASFERDYIKDWIYHAMNLPFSSHPGEVFHYDNSGPYMLSAMLSKRTGEKMVDWLKPRLFNPLEIPNPQWFTCPAGYNAASGSLFLSPEEMGKIGQLYLNEGAWEGKQLVSADWIKQATTKHIDTNLPVAPPISSPLAETSFCGKDAASGYGYLVWMCADGKSYRSHGNMNQNFVVIPEKQAVVVTSANENRGQKILDVIWDEIVPQL